MEYTEQQKKEYQAMRRKRKREQESLKDYLKTGIKNVARDPNKHEGRNSKPGAVFREISKDRPVRNLKKFNTFL